MNTVTTTPMQIPLVDLRAQYKPPQSENLNAIAAVLEQMTLLCWPEPKELRSFIRSA